MRTELASTLKQKLGKIIAEVESSQKPLLITKQGKPAIYMMSAETYESLNERLKILEGISRGERAIEEGHVVSHAQAKKRLGRWLN